MKRKRDISDLIRDNQHKLNERPSPRAWRKLESRLDSHTNQKPSFLYRQLAMVAAVVLLVAIISLLPFSSRQEKNMAVAENAKSDWNWSAQNLETVYTDDTKNIRKVIEFQRHLKDRYTNPIEEGTQTKKLLASSQISKENVNQSPSTNSNPTIAFDASAVEETEQEAIVFSDAIGDKSEQIQTPTAESFPQKRVFKSKKNDDLKLSKTQPKKKANNNKWNWLIGKWSGNENKTTWQKLNSQSVFSEDYMIKKDGNQIIFIIKSDSKLPYKLVSSNQFLNIFENKNQDQAIIKRIDNNSFSITIIEKSTGKKLVKVFEK